MKRMIALALMALLCMTAIAAHAEDGSRTLVVYFDYSENMGDLSGMTVDAITSASLNAKTENTQGNLQVMAQAIQEATGAEVFPIHVEEDQENNRTCTIIGLPEDFDSYDTIYFGTPVWHAQLPQPVASFLQQVDWSGKRVIVFGIHLGSGWGRNIQQIKDLQPNADVIEGMTVYASAANGEARQEMMNYLTK